MAQMTPLVHVVLYVFFTITITSAGVLHGTVSDNYDHPLADVSIELTGLSSPEITESAVTQADGGYSIEGFSAGSYSVRLVKQWHDTLDTTVLLGDDSTRINFVMDSIVPLQGTLHSGEITDETWKPEDNPHVIAGNIEITGTLYIAPGCTVTTEKGAMKVLNTLIIGDTAGVPTLINTMAVIPDTLSRTISFNNCTFNALSYTSSLCNSLTIRNCTIKTWSDSFEPIAGEMTIDSSSITVIDSGDIYLTARQNIKITNSGFYGARWWVGNMGGSFRFSTSYIRGASVTIYNSLFKPYMQVYAFSTAPPSQSLANIDISYCPFHSLTTNRSDKDTIPANKINHCTISTLTINEHLQDSVKNSIIGTLRGNNSHKTFYSSSYLNNLITDTIRYVDIYGLLSNIRTNGNGDSCDLWYNMKADPLFTDSDSVAVGDASPAIGAATDGTNIGYYQGESGIPPLKIAAARPGAIMKNGSRRSFPVLLLPSGTVGFGRGQSLRSGSALLFDPAGRVVRRFNSGTASIDGPTLPPGIYFVKPAPSR